jgi:hypothetical protein
LRSPLLDGILNSAGLILTFALGLPNEVSAPLRFSMSLEERHQAERQTRDSIISFSDGGAPASERGYNDWPTWQHYVSIVTGLIQRDLAENQLLVTRLVELHGYVHQLTTFASIVTSIPPQGMQLADAEKLESSLRSQVSAICLDICERCNSILEEAGVFDQPSPPRRTKKGPTHSG